MNSGQEYIAANREMWNKRTAVHVTSDFYDVPAFLNGRNSLNSIELELLSGVEGKRILHLQCHFGQDTLSLARLGATVTGVDLSDAAIAVANDLTAQLSLQAQARFICCDLYSLPEHLEDRFDIVFTSYGTIGWLPDLDKWAAVVQRYLKPGGSFIMADFHPTLWMFDDDFTTVKYDYFNTAPIVEEATGSYTDRSAELKDTSWSWNHPLSEIISALVTQGLQLQVFREFDYSPYNCFNNTVEQDGRYYIRGMEGKLPMVYAFKFYKP
ncbi:class I SAM-dependent methyltransferase [Chitinophaga solisilvae]|uniref:Methyltransferase domain-containing protein n=1 Tax=Chitinophaga solisilvae TaxID=1233460 RepID=A0A433WEJ6_9BACT|nr:class I SAM-dependent methyltransferase [Chitinophaga solisilvae]NSL89406.1 methyltransferase domain-containing protein [Chitinophaga solisilvae]